MRELNTMEDFQRNITHRVLLRKDNSISLTGTIQDRYHDIQVEIIAGGETLEIIDSRATFRKSPTGDCCNVADRLKQLHGFTIGPGLSKKLNQALSGAQGCGNVRTMLAGLLPLALNVKAAAGVSDEEEMLDTIHHQLIGTCAGYVKPEEGEVCPADPQRKTA